MNMREKVNKFIYFLEALTEQLKKRTYKNEVDYEYIKLVNKVLNEGVYRQGRNGGTFSIFGHQVRFDLSKGLPLLTTKKLVLRSTIHELVWFLKGKTSAQYLIDNKVHIWDLWLDENKDLPYTYPKQWRNFTNASGKPIDQITEAINLIKNDPYSRRIIVCAWNPSELDKVALPWCHSLFQFYVQNGKLSCQLYQRSGDLGLGVPTNWLGYALLTHVVAHICNLEVGEFIWSGGDIHIYENQVEGLKTQLKRPSHRLATVKINPELKNIDDLKFEDIEIQNYISEAFLKLPVSK